MALSAGIGYLDATRRQYNATPARVCVLATHSRDAAGPGRVRVGVIGRLGRELGSSEYDSATPIGALAKGGTIREELFRKAHPEKE